MGIDARELRNCLGRFATGVTVVACRTDDGIHGVTVNAFSAVSLDPPLVLVSVDRRSRACRHLEDTPFAVNVLPETGQDLALHFAGRPQRDLDVDWDDEGPAPRLAGCVAFFACSPWARYDGGDHVIYLGKIEEFAGGNGDPLVFHGGRFRGLGEGLAGSPWLDSLDCPSGAGWFSALSTR
ncbi:MAG: flavin reductase [Streptosporangiales bacterium]|nr:flavin reductase [Streptosporangiales bacterium]